MNNLILYISMSINAGSLVLCFYMLVGMYNLHSQLITHKEQIYLLGESILSTAGKVRDLRETVYNKE